MLLPQVTTGVAVCSVFLFARRLHAATTRIHKQLASECKGRCEMPLASFGSFDNRYSLGCQPLNAGFSSSAFGAGSIVARSKFTASYAVESDETRLLFT